VKDAGRMAAPHAWRRCRLRFDANFASPAYLIETDVCYRSSCGDDLEFPVRRRDPAASTRELKARRAAVSQFARSQQAVNYIAEQAIHREFVGTI
jgi:hypothetical protein